MSPELCLSIIPWQGQGQVKYQVQGQIQAKCEYQTHGLSQFDCKGFIQHESQGQGQNWSQGQFDLCSACPGQSSKKLKIVDFGSHFVLVSNFG